MEEQYVLSTEEEELVSNVQSSIIEGDQDYLPDNKKSSISDIQALLSNLGVSNGSTTSNNGVTTTNSAFISSAIRQLIPSIELQSLTKLQMESTRLIDSSVEELQSFNTISESKRNGNQGQVLSEQVHVSFCAI